MDLTIVNEIKLYLLSAFLFLIGFGGIFAAVFDWGPKDMSQGSKLFVSFLFAGASYIIFKYPKSKNQARLLNGENDDTAVSA